MLNLFRLVITVFTVNLVLRSAVGAVIPVQITRRSENSNTISRRAQKLGSLTLDDNNDLTYTANITIGEQPFIVLVDTGSSELWVKGKVKKSTESGQQAQLHYAVGSVNGPIKFADVEFAGYTLKRQSFIEVQPGSTTIEQTGFIGLGPNSGSTIFTKLGGADGAETPVDSIFNQNKSAPNFVTTLLGRGSDPTDPFPGFLTVGEVLSGYESIVNQPKLPVVRTANANQQHWMTLLDEGGIVVNGKKVDLPETVVSTTPNKKQHTVVFDSGYSLPQVPKRVTDAMYSEVVGAKWNGNKWEVPCKTEINVTFSFGRQTFPVHPLDVVQKKANGTCFGAFQPISIQGDYQDMILGMAFLRNVYVLNNYGDFVDGATESTADPYMQLLSTTTDLTLTRKEFAAARLGDKAAAKELKTYTPVSTLASSTQSESSITSANPAAADTPASTVSDTPDATITTAAPADSSSPDNMDMVKIGGAYRTNTSIFMTFICALALLVLV